MNVLFVNSTRKWGGVKTWTLEAAACLREHGHHALIVARPGFFPDKAEAMGIPAARLAFGPDFNPLAIARFLGLMRGGRFDLAVLNVGKDLCTAGVAARMLGVPVVHRVGLPGDMRDTPKVRLLHRMLAPAVLVPCEYIKQGLLARHAHLRPGEITVVRTGKAPAAAPTPTPPAAEPLRLIMTSQLNPDKGHAEVLRALAALAAEGSDFHLRVLGTGRDEAELRALAVSLGLGGKVEFQGFSSDVPAVLRASDVFILDSRSEGLPNALLEAMAQGLVPVARAVGAVPEVHPPSLAALLLPAVSPGQDGGPELTAVLRRLLAAPRNEIEAMKRASLDQCRAAFEQRAQCMELEAFLLRVAGK